MDKKRTRFSLSRKRKKSHTEEEDKNKDVCLLDESAGKTVLSLDEISVESKENLTKTPFTDGKVEPSTQRINNAKKSIATWFKKPCNPKTVSCPMCGKVVMLSKINQHLDNNCKSYFGQHNLSTNKATSTCLLKANRLPVSNSHRESEKKGTCTVSVTSQDKTASAKDCKVDAEHQSRDEKSTLLEVSSTSDTAIILDSDIASLEKKANEIDRNKESYDTLNNGCDVTCDGICEQESSSQCSFAKVVAETEEILTHESGNLQTKQIDLQSDQSTEGHNKSLAEENPEDSKDNGNEDYEPYYQANFKLVLNNVLSNEDDRKLFDESDNHIIDTFNGMSPEEQKLYIRLFQRKRGWFRCSKLEYPKISSNLTPILNSLVQKGKIVNNVSLNY